MKKRLPHDKRSLVRSDRKVRQPSRRTIAVAKQAAAFVKLKDEPIHCASPPCYLPEIED
ncbi:MAG TPA: hypothetical protein VGI85_10165 [Chthoniobacterales bacterium]|jgi:hypothetical protein